MARAALSVVLLLAASLVSVPAQGAALAVSAEQSGLSQQPSIYKKIDSVADSRRRRLHKRDLTAPAEGSTRNADAPALAPRELLSNNPTTKIQPRNPRFLRLAPPRHPISLSYGFQTHQLHSCAVYSYSLRANTSTTLRICHDKDTPFSLQTGMNEADSTFGALRGGDGTKRCRSSGARTNDPAFAYTYMPQGTTGSDTVCVERTLKCHELPRLFYFSIATSWPGMPGGWRPYVESMGTKITFDVIASHQCAA